MIISKEAFEKTNVNSRNAVLELMCLSFAFRFKAFRGHGSQF